MWNVFDIYLPTLVNYPTAKSSWPRLNMNRPLKWLNLLWWSTSAQSFNNPFQKRRVLQCSDTIIRIESSNLATNALVTQAVTTFLWMLIYSLHRRIIYPKARTDSFEMKLGNYLNRLVITVYYSQWHPHAKINRAPVKCQSPRPPKIQQCWQSRTRTSFTTGKISSPTISQWIKFY